MFLIRGSRANGVTRVLTADQPGLLSIVLVTRAPAIVPVAGASAVAQLGRQLVECERPAPAPVACTSERRTAGRAQVTLVKTNGVQMNDSPGPPRCATLPGALARRRCSRRAADCADAKRVRAVSGLACGGTCCPPRSGEPNNAHHSRCCGLRGLNDWSARP